MNKLPQIWEILTIQEYIDQIDPSKEAFFYQKILNNASATVKFLARCYGEPGEVVEIKIKTVPEIDPIGGEGYVRLTEGLVDYCVGIKDNVSLNNFCYEIMQDRPHIQAGHLLFLLSASVWLSWATAHEALHGLNRHQGASDALANLSQQSKDNYNFEDLWPQALEYDADLCAVAAVFRMLYHAAGCQEMDGQDLRKIIAAALFFGILDLPFASKSAGSHQSWPARFYHMVIKLSHMQVVDRGPSFQKEANDMAPELAGQIFEFVKKCAGQCFLDKENCIHKFWDELINTDNSPREIILAWQEIENIVREKNRY